MYNAKILITIKQVVMRKKFLTAINFFKSTLASLMAAPINGTIKSDKIGWVVKNILKQIIDIAPIYNSL